MLVVSFAIAFEMPKSMSLRRPLTRTKLAGLRSVWTTFSLWMTWTASSICDGGVNGPAKDGEREDVPAPRCTE